MISRTIWRPLLIWRCHLTLIIPFQEFHMINDVPISWHEPFKKWRNLMLLFLLFFFFHFSNFFLDIYTICFPIQCGALCCRMCFVWFCMLHDYFSCFSLFHSFIEGIYFATGTSWETHVKRRFISWLWLYIHTRWCYIICVMHPIRSWNSPDVDLLIWTCIKKINENKGKSW